MSGPIIEVTHFSMRGYFSLLALYSNSLYVGSTPLGARIYKENCFSWPLGPFWLSFEKDPPPGVFVVFILIRGLNLCIRENWIRLIPTDVLDRMRILLVPILIVKLASLELILSTNFLLDQDLWLVIMSYLSLTSYNLFAIDLHLNTLISLASLGVHL